MIINESKHTGPLNPDDNDALLETAGLKLSTFAHPNGVGVSINGQDYVYSSKDYDSDELFAKFNKIKKYSDGKALAWIKKVSTAVKLN